MYEIEKIPSVEALKKLSSDANPSTIVKILLETFLNTFPKKQKKKLKNIMTKEVEENLKFNCIFLKFLSLLFNLTID